MLIFGERHLRAILADCEARYNGRRPTAAGSCTLPGPDHPAADLLRKRHVRRRDAMIPAVRTHLPQARVHGAAAGLHLTLTFGSALPAGALPASTGQPGVGLATAAPACGVKTQPPSWHSQRPGQPGLVLGYAASTPAEIEDGVAVIGSILAQQPSPH